MIKALMMTSALFVGIAASAPAAAQPGAETNLRSGRCSLVVNGRSRISGRCLYSVERNGSFYIREAGRRRDNFYFAYVNIDGRTAEGSWNGTRGSTHAHDSLGRLRRNGACWVNRRARVCLWQR